MTITHLDPVRQTAALAADVRAGLGGRPKTLPPKYFYDAAGKRVVRSDHSFGRVLPNSHRAGDPARACR